MDNKIQLGTSQSPALSKVINELPEKSVARKVCLAQGGTPAINGKDEDFGKVIAYAVLMFGIPDKKIPKEGAERKLIYDNLREEYPKVTLKEMVLSIKYASTNRTDVNIGLYGGVLSFSFMAMLINAYLKFKAPIVKEVKKRAEDNMNNVEQFKGLVDIMKSNPEGKKTLEMIQEIGGEKSRNYDKIREATAKIKLPHENAFQKYMKDFDRKRKAQSGGMYVNIAYLGKSMNVTEYMQYRLKQDLK